MTHPERPDDAADDAAGEAAGSRWERLDEVERAEPERDPTSDAERLGTLSQLHPRGPQGT